MQLERGKFPEVDCAGISRAPTEPEGRALPPFISGIRRSSVTSGYVYGDHCETINHTTCGLMSISESTELKYDTYILISMMFL